MTTTIVAFIVLAFAAGASGLPAPPLRVEFMDGRVTIVANDVRASDILVEWGHAGGTDVQGTDLLGGRRVSLNVQNADESQTLEQIVGPSIGTIAAMKSVPSIGSRFARIILTTGPRPVPPTASPDDPPEARYQYTPAPDVTATSEIVFSTLPSKSPSAAPATDVPEAVFDYTAQFKGASLPAPLPGAATPVTVPAADPETRFHYFTPDRAWKRPAGSTRGGS